MTSISTNRMHHATVAALLALSLGIGSAFAAGQHSGGHGDQQRMGSGRGHMDGGQASGGHDHGFAFGAPGKASDVDRTVEITMKDNIFEPESLSVKPGETIRFKIVNKGEFLHEFGIGTAAMHAKHREQMMTMMEHGMIEADRINHEKMKMQHGAGQMPMAHDDPNSILLEPGKSGEVIWKFTRAMDLEFACNMPGHYESGMMGEFRFR